MKANTERTLWEKYRKVALLGLGAFIIAYAGSQYYFNQELKQKLSASELYDNMITLADAEKTVEAAVEAKELMDKYAQTPYAPLAALMLAKLSVEEGDLSAAGKQLEFVIAKEKSGPVLEIAKVRMARILSEEKKYTEALDMLNTELASESFLSIFQEARGDIFLLQNKKDEAREAYQMAMQTAIPGAPNQRLQLKQIELGPKEN